MLRKFRVNVNGKAYVVELEELGAPAATQATIQAPVQATQQPATQQPAAPVLAAQEAPAVAPIDAPSGKGITIEAPMPGNILSVLVKVGEKVSFEQPLIVLEAMKMENELVSPKNGVVSAIYVSEGTAVDAGKPIISIE